MKTAVSQTSLESFHSFTTQQLQRKEAEVLAFFKSSPGAQVTREQLARALDWKEASVCGRVNSLVTKRVLEEIDGGRTAAGRPAKLVRLPRSVQMELL